MSVEKQSDSCVPVGAALCLCYGSVAAIPLLGLGPFLAVSAGVWGYAWWLRNRWKQEEAAAKTAALEEAKAERRARQAYRRSRDWGRN